jgi:putative membrane protein
MMMGFWVLGILLVVWAMASLRPGQQAPPTNETPVEILKRRYASGAITEEQFEQGLRTLA